MSNSNEQAFPSPKQILGSGTPDYHEIGPEPGLSKLEYALIHSTWEPPAEDIAREMNIDKNRNPHNEPYKPRIRERWEIMKELKITHFTRLLMI